jgi:acyl-CoA thioesterase I
MKVVKWSILIPLLALGGCSSGEPARAVEARPGESASADPEPASPRAASAKIVVIGDSLTAGYGLDMAQSYPSLLQRRLDAAGYRYEVVNAGVSGDTSAGGLRRLDWALDGNVAVLIVALGANDGLRGLPVEQMRKNLGDIIERGRDKGARVLLAGMEAPPNYGPAYTAAFRQTYRDLSKEYDVPLVPFLLDRVAGIPDLNIADGIHPNPAGARIVEQTVWQVLEPLLDRPSR